MPDPREFADDLGGPARLREFKPDPAYTVLAPRVVRPIVLIGAGGIVRDAHLPGYARAGFPVQSIYNRSAPRAEALAREYGIGSVFTALPDIVAQAPEDAVFDIALMPDQYVATLEALPDGAPVLIQKPLGNDLAQTSAILDVCRRKHLTAAVNTQLRFAPYVSAARAAIAAGAIGELYDVAVHVEVDTPWDRFPHVVHQPRLEITQHSVHYVDLILSFLGLPDRVSATTVRHPAKDHASSRSMIALHYDARQVRAVIDTNHDHRFGSRYEQSYIKWEGTRGAIRAQMGLLLDYPIGGEDRLEIQRDDQPDAGWSPLPFEGSWFPDAFGASMGALLRYLDGSVSTLPTSVEHVWDTMSVVEAAYEAAERGGVRPRTLRG